MGGALVNSSAPVCECGEQTHWEPCSEAKYHFFEGSREALDLLAYEKRYGVDAPVWLCYGCGEWGVFAWPPAEAHTD